MAYNTITYGIGIEYGIGDWDKKTVRRDIYEGF
jgi:hypothetical protein